MKQQLLYIGKTLQSIGDNEPSCDCGVFDTEEKAWTWVKSQAEQFALDNFPDKDDKAEVVENDEEKTIKVYGNYYYTNFYGAVKPTYMNDPDKYTLDRMRELDEIIKQQEHQAKSEVYYCPEYGFGC